MQVMSEMIPILIMMRISMSILSTAGIQNHYLLPLHLLVVMSNSYHHPISTLETELKHALHKNPLLKNSMIMGDVRLGYLFVQLHKCHDTNLMDAVCQVTWQLTYGPHSHRDLIGTL